MKRNTSKSRDTRVLFSGKNGPLGFALDTIKIPHFELCGFSSVECNLLDRDKTEKYFKNFVKSSEDKEVAYLHVAAVSGGSHLSDRIPATLFVDNITIAINALEAAKAAEINRVILVLSTSCYSSKLENPKETDLHWGPIETVEFGYSYAKRMLEVLMRAYNKQYGMSISCVLVNGIIGAGMHFEEDRSILPAALIKKFSTQGDTTQEIELWGDGTPVREYTSSTDLAKAIIWCVVNQEIDTLLNIGNTKRISVKELAYLVARRIGIDTQRIKFNGNLSHGKQVQSTNNQEFLKLSNFHYQDLELAIDAAINYFASINRDEPEK
jgi:GDP-L-fucose synthase